MESVDRRVVSVVFADLADFTALSERLDAEDVARVQDTYFSLASEVVAAHGGQVEKFIGDAVMATFGTERSADDDAERAVRAGLRIVDAVDRLDRRLRLADGTVRVRVGVDTGEVVVTRRGGTWRVTGDAVNTAARLQSVAEPGTVVLGDETAFAVAHAYVVSPARVLHLKGKSAPVQSWAVTAERAEPRRGLRLHGLAAPFLGRDEQLARLASFLDDDARAVLVVAPPGAGKTRLVDELAARLTPDRACWTVRLNLDPGRGYEAVASLLTQAWPGAPSSGGTPPDSDGASSAAPTGADPWETRVAAALERAGHDAAAARRVAGLCADVVAGRTPDAVPADLYPAWTATLDAAAPRAVWVVEDVHLAAPDLHAFLRHAVTADGDRHLVLTSRPPVDPALATDAAVVPLEPLSVADSRRLVDELLGTGVVPGEYADGVAVASGGNPLFVEELVRSWIQSGVLVRRPTGAWAFTSAGRPTEVPTTVHAIYQGQLDALPRAARSVVERGSVPGTTFPLDALPSLGVDDAGEPLADLTRGGLLVGPHSDAVSTRAYTYRHALLRDTAYGSLGRRRRAELHARFARWLEGLEGPVATELVGTHLAHAYDSLPTTAAGLEDGTTSGDLAAEAATWLDRAATTHLVASPQRSAALLDRALTLPAGTGPERLARRLTLAEALRRSGDLEPAMAAFSTAAEAAMAREDADALVTAALGFEDALYASRLPRTGESVRLLRAAEAAVGPEDPRHVAVASALGRALLYAGDRSGAEGMCRRAVDVAQQHDDAEGLARALLALRVTREGPEHLAARLADAERAVVAAARTDDLELRLETVRLRLLDLLAAGDLAVADDAIADATALVDALGRPLHRWYPPMWRATRALMDGRFADAARLIAEFGEEGRRAHYAATDHVVTIQRLRLHLDTGDDPEALHAVERHAQADPDRWSFAPALVLARLGRHREAQAHLDHYARRPDAVPEDLARSSILAMLAEAAAEVGDAGTAATLAPLLEPYRDQVLVLGSGALCLGSGAYALGLCRRTTGDLAGARDLLEAAVTHDDAATAPAAATWARAELAATLAGLGDDERARSVAREAADAAGTLGMRPVLDRLTAAHLIGSGR
ncbi:adenylate/guanylate cyclase domain-containing protein [Actinotalea sp. AC32]|nr:adenylate/guanylate cyclase domain-containing protein [Actinotalea sp. AC32]